MALGADWKTERAGSSSQSVVEIISAKAALREAVMQMQRTVKSECLSMEKPPYLVHDPSATDNEERDAVARGVICRFIIEPSVLSYPNAADHMRERLANGACGRVFNNLPQKMVLVDNTAALLPLAAGSTDGSVILLSGCSLLDALHQLFEMTWNLAVPLENVLDSSATIRQNYYDDGETGLLLSLMSTGENDKVLAGQLRVSARTFARRVDGLMDILHARSRFQAGWIAHDLCMRGVRK